MQKKIIALAVAGVVSGLAFAQSNVTVYGVADVFFGQASADTAAGAADQGSTYVNSGQMSGSRIGFKGTEDLGNGLKALFTLEYVLTPDENTGVGGVNTQSGSNARQQFVGLTGGWGTAVAGRLYSPGYNIANKFNAGIGGGMLSSYASMQGEAGTSIDLGSRGRLNNAIAYVSPNFSGFTVTAAYSANGENVNDETDRIYGLGLDYDNGPIAVSYGYHNITSQAAAGNTSALTFGTALPAGATLVSTVSGTPGLFAYTTAGAAAAETKTKEHILAGSYDFGMAKIFATWQKLDADRSGTAGSLTENKIWTLGAAIPVFGNGSLRLQYADLSVDRAGGANATAADAKSWSIGYIHALSKRTSIYGGYNKVSNDRNQDATIAATGNGLRPSAGDNAHTYGIGVNHSF